MPNTAKKDVVERGRVVCGRYTYWTEIPVRVGDKVLVAVSAPWNQVFGNTTERVVTSLESDYYGPCQKVLEVLERASSEEEA